MLIGDADRPIKSPMGFERRPLQLLRKRRSEQGVGHALRLDAGISGRVLDCLLQIFELLRPRIVGWPDTRLLVSLPDSEIVDSDILLSVRQNPVDDPASVEYLDAQAEFL